jgi:hypothetical protein
MIEFTIAVHAPASGDFIFTNAKMHLVMALHRLPARFVMLFRTMSVTMSSDALLPSGDDAASRSSSWMTCCRTWGQAHAWPQVPDAVLDGGHVIVVRPVTYRHSGARRLCDGLEPSVAFESSATMII